MLLKRIEELHPELGYYQGLNFYGLFLLEFTRDLDTSQTLFARLAERVLSRYFADSFRNLKCLFYILDSLVQDYLPRLHRKFRSLSITSR